MTLSNSDSTWDYKKDAQSTLLTVYATYCYSEDYLYLTVTMQKAIVVLFTLSAIACTTYGAPANAKNDDIDLTENVITEKSGLVSTRNRRGLSASKYGC